MKVDNDWHQEGEDEDEQEEEEEKGHDGRQSVHQSYHKIAKGRPVSERTGLDKLVRLSKYLKQTSSGKLVC